jgi:hypothetical protein
MLLGQENESSQRRDATKKDPLPSALRFPALKYALYGIASCSKTVRLLVQIFMNKQQTKHGGVSLDIILGNSQNRRKACP